MTSSVYYFLLVAMAINQLVGGQTHPCEATCTAFDHLSDQFKGPCNKSADCYTMDCGTPSAITYSIDVHTHLELHPCDSPVSMRIKLDNTAYNLHIDRTITQDTNIPVFVFFQTISIHLNFREIANETVEFSVSVTYHSNTYTIIPSTDIPFDRSCCPGYENTTHNPLCGPSIYSCSITTGTNPITPVTNLETPGTNPVTPGSIPVTPGTLPVTPGTIPVTSGTNPITTETSSITTGTTALATGTNPITTGTTALATGTNPITTGTTALATGTNPKTAVTSSIETVTTITTTNDVGNATFVSGASQSFIESNLLFIIIGIFLAIFIVILILVVVLAPVLYFALKKRKQIRSTIEYKRMRPSNLEVSSEDIVEIS